MKYNAKQLPTGDFAVFTGKKYFTNTVTSNYLEAKQQACVMSMGFYKEQADKAWEELQKLSEVHEFNDSIKMVGYEYYVDRSDLDC